MIRRKILQASVAATLLEIGFESADQLALETLTELLQSCKNNFITCYCGFIKYVKGRELI